MMREECRVSRRINKIGPGVSAYSVVSADVSTHLAFCEFTAKDGLEAFNVGVIFDEGGDDVIARFVGGL
jgi:hypothetical protein